MADAKITRDMQTREIQERPKQWMPAESLPEPDKQAGYAYRWIRVASNGQMDQKNLSAKLREGWEPVPSEEQPQYQLLVDPTSRFKDNIEIGGLLLCKTPLEFVEQRNAYYAKQTVAQTEAVDNTMMRQSDARMPMFKERKTTVSVGKGS
jgi:hypothetical protein